MNIYLISQRERTGYDTYDAAIVAAGNEEAARRMHPQGDLGWKDSHEDYSPWASSPDNVDVVLMGTSKVPVDRVILTSFNAG